MTELTEAERRDLFESDDPTSVIVERVVAARVQQARAEALREAAEAVMARRDQIENIALPAEAAFATVLDLLETRADAEEAGR